MLQLALDAQGEMPGRFDLDQWLQDWLQRPQPALGGVPQSNSCVRRMALIPCAGRLAPCSVVRTNRLA